MTQKLIIAFINITQFNFQYIKMFKHILKYQNNPTVIDTQI